MSASDAQFEADLHLAYDEDPDAFVTPVICMSSLSAAHYLEVSESTVEKWLVTGELRSLGVEHVADMRVRLDREADE